MKQVTGALLSATALFWTSVATAQTGDDDVWPEAWCRQAATQCIENPGAWPTPNECWDAAVGNHCPDRDPRLPGTPLFPPQCDPNENICEVIPF